mgnify:CR=1 FL=1
MKKVLIIAALIAAATAVSCNKNNIEEPQVPGQLKFTCTLPGTKFAIDDQGKTAWEAGDEILIHAGASGNKSITVTLAAGDISNAGKTATITFTEDQLAPYVHYSGGVQDYNSTYYLIYPASAAYAGTMYYNTRIVNYDEPVLAGYNNGNNFIVHNLCGIMKYKVTGDFDSYELVGNNDERVSWTEYQVRLALDSDDNEIFQEKPTSDGASMSPLTSATGPVVADGTTDNWLVFPGGVDLTGGFTIRFKKAGSTVKTASTHTAISLEVGDFLNLGDITGNLNDFVAPSVSTHESAITGATDLSAQQANCFVISSAGAYKFPAYKGGSTTSPGNVFSVELLWETYNNAETVTANSVIAAVDFDGPTNYIYFETPATLKPGNALIAAKDFEGNIIWSWHIWIPATAFTSSDYGISTQKFMSRNLGALVDTEAGDATVDARSYGFFYQWGRKDPFIGAKKFNSSSLASISGTAKTYSTTKFTIAQSIANPTTYVQIKADWMTPENSDLWAENSDKSIYDPCPAGYRVPKRISTDPIWSDVTTVATWEPNSTYGWWKLGTAVFPFAGYIDYDGSSVSHAYDRARIWNAHKSTTDYAYDQQIWYEDGAWKSKPGWQHRTACGNSVRCVVDE